jgi:hypothetical protein
VRLSVLASWNIPAVDGWEEGTQIRKKIVCSRAVNPRVCNLLIVFRIKSTYDNFLVFEVRK